MICQLFDTLNIYVSITSPLRLRGELESAKGPVVEVNVFIVVFVSKR